MTEWQEVPSQMFSEVGYDKETLEVTVRMRQGGGEYMTQNVSPEKYAQFLSAPSMGRFWHQNLK